jgi:hypothetical protein
MYARSGLAFGMEDTPDVMHCLSGRDRRQLGEAQCGFVPSEHVECRPPVNTKVLPDVVCPDCNVPMWCSPPYYVCEKCFYYFRVADGLPLWPLPPGSHMSKPGRAGKPQPVIARLGNPELRRRMAVMRAFCDARLQPEVEPLDEERDDED